MRTALALYEDGLRGGPTRFVDRAGRRRPLPISQWTGRVTAADEGLLARCTGPTLDAGCGPGRLTAALTKRAVPALGVDISALAVRMTRQRGGMALRRNVFDPLPGGDRWNNVLLADGNIGIGGDPVTLLRRCRQLLRIGGTVLLDVGVPGSGLLIEELWLEDGGSRSASFRWCRLGVDALPQVATAAGLLVDDLWCVDGRWQAQLVRPQ